MARANFSQHSNEGKNGMSAPRNVVRPNGVAVPLDAPSQNEVNRWIQKRQWWRMAKLRDAWAPWLRMLFPVAPKRAYLLVRATASGCGMRATCRVGSSTCSICSARLAWGTSTPGCP